MKALVQTVNALLAIDGCMETRWIYTRWKKGKRRRKKQDVRAGYIVGQHTICLASTWHRSKPRFKWINNPLHRLRKYHQLEILHVIQMTDDSRGPDPSLGFFNFFFYFFPSTQLTLFPPGAITVVEIHIKKKEKNPRDLSSSVFYLLIPAPSDILCPRWQIYSITRIHHNTFGCASLFFSFFPFISWPTLWLALPSRTCTLVVGWERPALVNSLTLIYQGTTTSLGWIFPLL